MYFFFIFMGITGLHQTFHNWHLIPPRMIQQKISKIEAYASYVMLHTSKI